MESVLKDYDVAGLLSKEPMQESAPPRSSNCENTSVRKEKRLAIGFTDNVHK